MFTHQKAKRKKKSPSPGNILLLRFEESWRKRSKVKERCERMGGAVGGRQGRKRRKIERGREMEVSP